MKGKIMTERGTLVATVRTRWWVYPLIRLLAPLLWLGVLRADPLTRWITRHGITITTRLDRGEAA